MRPITLTVPMRRPRPRPRSRPVPPEARHVALKGRPVARFGREAQLVEIPPYLRVRAVLGRVLLDGVISGPRTARDLPRGHVRIEERAPVRGVGMNQTGAVQVPVARAARITSGRDQPGPGRSHDGAQVFARPSEKVPARRTEALEVPDFKPSRNVAAIRPTQRATAGGAPEAVPRPRPRWACVVVLSVVRLNRHGALDRNGPDPRRCPTSQETPRA